MSIGAQLSAETPNPWLARQPILTKDESVVGYELLFRESASDSQFHSPDADSATSNTIDTLNVLGLDAVCDGRLAFINCTQQMLLKDYFLLLPPEKVETRIQMLTAEKDGFTLFQGYFSAAPSTCGPAISPNVRWIRFACCRPSPAKKWISPRSKNSSSTTLRSATVCSDI